MIKYLLMFIGGMVMGLSHAEAQEKFTTSKKVIAHRGLSSQYPENTLISFREAIKTQATIIELDTYISTDNIPFCMHDRDLTRTTNGLGFIDQHPAEYLKRLRAFYPDKFGDQFFKEKLPSLEEVMDLIMKTSDKFLFIEVKSLFEEDPAYNERVGAILYRSVMENFRAYKNRFAFISFDLSILRRIRALDETVQLAPIFNRLLDRASFADQAIQLGADRVIFSKKLLTDPSVFDKTDRVKHFVYTVLPDEFSQMESLPGLYGFATDFSDRIR